MTADNPKRPLAGVDVLDASQDYAGALCAMHLSDLGARVIRVARDGDLRTYAHRGKTIIDPAGANIDAMLHDLADRVDVVIEDGPADTRVLASMADDPDSGAVYCWMPAFSADHPLGHEPIPVGALEAYAGLYEVPLGRKPVAHSLGLLGVTGAAWATVGILGALIARERDGRGQLVELSLHDVAYSLLELNAMFTVQPPKSWPSLMWAATPFIGGYEAADGTTIYIHAGLRKHLPRLLDELVRQAPTQGRKLRRAISQSTFEDPTSIQSVNEARAIRKSLARVFKEHPAIVWERRLSRAGLCAVVARSPRAWLAHEHPRESGQIVKVQGRQMPGPIVSIEGMCVEARGAAFARIDDVMSELEFRPRADEDAPEDTRAPLADIDVLDFTQVIAGPTAARTLAELGARVHRIENPHFGAPWVEAFHIAFNAGKTSETIDLATQVGREALGRVIGELEPDVIVQNLRPGASGEVGFSARDVAALTDKKFVYAHLTAYGVDGPWGDRPGWEQTAQAASGIQDAWGGEDGPDLYPLPCNDLCTGLHGAIAVLAALFSGDDSPGAYTKVHTALTSSATLMLARATFDGLPLTRGKSSLGSSPSSRFYKFKNGWAYLHVRDLDALWEIDGLERTRGSNRRALELSLESEFSRATIEHWRAKITRAGVRDRIALVPRRTQREVLDDPRARSTNLVIQREHHGVGVVTETGSALHLARTGCVELGPAAPVARGGARPGAAGWVKQQVVGAVTLGLGRRGARKK